MSANLVLVPIRTNTLYDKFGVDFLLDADVAAGDETRGEATFVKWVEGADQRDEDSGGDPLAQADLIITEEGYRRTSGWEFSTLCGYARVEKLTGLDTSK